MMHIVCSVILGGVLFYMLDPVVTLLERRKGVRRGAAMGIVFSMVFVIIIGFFAFVMPAVKQDVLSFAGQASELSGRIDGVVETLLDAMFGKGNTGDFRMYFAGLAGKAKNGVVAAVKDFFDNAALLYKNIAAVLVDIITGIIFAYYFVKDKERIARWLLGLFPYGRQNDVLKVSREIGAIVASFVSGQFTVAIIVGVLETVGLAAIGVPVPWLFGIIGGLSNLLPYVGPFIGAIPASLAALLISPWRGILTVLLFVLVQQLDNNFISPKIIEGRLGVHPVVSIIVLFVGGELWGLGGILLGIPLFAILRCLLRYASEAIMERRRKKA